MENEVVSRPTVDALEALIINCNNGLDEIGNPIYSNNYLIYNQGYECLGGTMQLIDKHSADSACCTSDDIEDARAVANKLDIPIDIEFAAPQATANAARKGLNVIAICVGDMSKAFIRELENEKIKFNIIDGGK